MLKELNFLSEISDILSIVRKPQNDEKKLKELNCRD